MTAKFKPFTLEDIAELEKFNSTIPRGLPTEKSERIIHWLRKLAEARDALSNGADAISEIAAMQEYLTDEASIRTCAMNKEHARQLFELAGEE